MRTVQILTLALLLTAGLAMADDQRNTPEPTVKVEAVTEAAPLSANDIATRERHRALRLSMNEEIKSRTEAAQAEVAALAAELDRTFGDEQRRSIQLRVQDAKRSAQRDVTAIQLDYARRGGFDAQVRELETVLQKMDASQARVQPSPSTRNRHQGGE